MLASVCHYLGTSTHLHSKHRSPRTSKAVHLVFQYPHSLQDWFSLTHFACTFVGGAWACPCLARLASRADLETGWAHTDACPGMRCHLFSACVRVGELGNGVSRAPPSDVVFTCIRAASSICTICIDRNLNSAFLFDFGFATNFHRYRMEWGSCICVLVFPSVSFMRYHRLFLSDGELYSSSCYTFLCSKMILYRSTRILLVCILLTNNLFSRHDQNISLASKQEK